MSIAEQTIQEAICSDTHFEIRAFKTNRGKVALINEQMKTITSDITALSDVSALISIDALWIANTHFQDSKVGVVNGHYQLFKPGNAGKPVTGNTKVSLRCVKPHLAQRLGRMAHFIYSARTCLNL